MSPSIYYTTKESAKIHASKIQEWKKEIARFTKPELIEHLRNALMEVNRLKEQIKITDPFE